MYFYMAFTWFKFNFDVYIYDILLDSVVLHNVLTFSNDFVFLGTAWRK